jgi:NAD(P)-dependent dehydrogenase (short-subunit alcohol dehydrogenase family)
MGEKMKVKGKVCVVTGAAGGIGEATARRFAKEGAKGLVVADRDAERLDKVAKEIGALAVAGDIGQESEVKRLIAEAEKKYGEIDIFFSNAGIGRGGHEDATDKDWADSWAIHVMAHVYAARALVPQMLKRGEGYLLNTASAAGLLASMGSAPYGVTKNAAVALAEHLAIQYGDRGISRLGALPAGRRHQHAAHGRRDGGVRRRRDQHRRGGADGDRGDGRRDVS